jgi:hypothetical protein
MEYINLENVKNFDYGALGNCKSLRTVRLKNATLNCAAYSFYNCTGLKSVYISGNIALGQNFNGSDELESILIESGSLTGTLSGIKLPGVKYVVFPENMIRFPHQWLAKFSALKKLYIPDNVSYISSSTYDTDNGYTTWYTSAGNTASEFAAANGISQVDTSEHIHNLQDLTFYEDEYVTIKGQYCDDCGYGTNLSYTVSDLGKYPSEENSDITSTSPAATVTETATVSPTTQPTSSPTLSPTVSPMVSPAVTATETATVSPTTQPTFSPTLSPTVSPMVSPAASPTITPAKKKKVKKFSAPVVTIKKRKRGSIRYLEIRLKKYRGTHVQVYLKKGRQKFHKIKLKTEKIKKYRKGILKIRYLLRKKTVFIRIRTYKKAHKSKRYSRYFSSKKLHL